MTILRGWCEVEKGGRQSCKVCPRRLSILARPICQLIFAPLLKKGLKKGEKVFFGGEKLQLLPPKIVYPCQTQLSANFVHHC